MVLARSIAEAGAMSTTAHTHTGAPRLERPRDGRVLTGVCAAIARHLSIDPILVRIGFVVAATIGGAGFAAYVAGFLLIPEEGRERPLLRTLRGRRSATTTGVILIGVGLIATIDALTSGGLGNQLAGAVILGGLGVYVLMRPDDASA